LAKPNRNTEDVTSLGQLTYSGTTFNRATRTLHAEAQLTNLSTDVMSGPFSAVLHPFRPPSVGLANADGVTEFQYS
jgi:hypothetical protein